MAIIAISIPFALCAFAQYPDLAGIFLSVCNELGGSFSFLPLLSHHVRVLLMYLDN